MNNIVVSGVFDDIRARHVRFLHEASKLGRVHVMLLNNHGLDTSEAELSELQIAERLYTLGAIRCVSKVTVVDQRIEADTLPYIDEEPVTWVVQEKDANREKMLFCASHGLGYKIIKEADLEGWPEWPLEIENETNGRKKVIVSGCFDWLHSGHVRFFEETSELGDLYVVVGHDENVRMLKGERHPMFSHYERRYMVGSIRFVKQAMISSGNGWMDAEPEIEKVRPHIFAVNEDGDKPEKREFCERHGLEYVVLRRIPKQGLPRRESTVLRGF